MKIQTFSVVIGSKACDAHCPFCISHTTGFNEVEKRSLINVQNFYKAVDLAKMAGCTTVLFTGKGEPTLYPAEISEYLYLLTDEKTERPVFPLIELQTNAIRIARGEVTTDHLKSWKNFGLNTIAISVVDVRPENNKKIYLHHRDIPYPDLAETIEKLHDIGYSVRLCLMLHKGIVDAPERLDNVIQWAKSHQVEQLTVRPIRKPDNNAVAEGGEETAQYIAEHGVDGKTIRWLREHILIYGTHLLTLMNGNHQALVYDVNGQNVCMSDCLTVEPNGDDIRTLIFYNDGSLYYDWAYKGARLL